jgi:hypothetical protein
MRLKYLLKDSTAIFKIGKYLSAYIFFFLFVMNWQTTAQNVLFDFNNAPLYGSLPIYQTAGSITAHLTATGQGYSIQNVNVMGFTPQGFTGRMLYPSSINISDIRVHFDQILTDFSIMYACQELGCDDAATMRVTAYLNGVVVGTRTRTATFPGTWPVDTLSCSFPQGFDSVIIHYDSPPPTCMDYGTIYIADNMKVTQIPTGIISEGGHPNLFSLSQNYPNPFNPTTHLRFDLPAGKAGIAEMRNVKLIILDILGREITTLVNERLNTGTYEVEWDASNFSSGIYFYTLQTGDFTCTKRMVLLK